MTKILIAIFTAVSALQVMAVEPADSSKQNAFKVFTFTDEDIDPQLPDVEMDYVTYNNVDDVTTAGFKIILRGAEIDIYGAELYKASSQQGVNYKLNTFYPLRLHLGDSTSRDVVQHAYVYPRFPFTVRFYEEDSLVIHTDRGDKTIYLMDAFRTRIEFQDKINSLSASNRYLTHLNYLLYALLVALGLGIIIYLIRQHRVRMREKRERERLLTIISENEMDNRKLKDAVTSQFRKNFETINKLCYEYFELADSPVLKKSIYTQVESEINRLREPSKLKELEDSINEYCDNIMVKISQQLPSLTEKERTLLLYLYSGLSARTICILTDIQVKNFYMRRQRLKAKILASEAPDRLTFAALM